MTSESTSASLDLSVIGTAILIFFLVFTVWELLHGLRRGIFRQILHTGLMLVSATVAFFLTKPGMADLMEQYPTMSL